MPFPNGGVTNAQRRWRRLAGLAVCVGLLPAPASFGASAGADAPGGPRLEIPELLHYFGVMQPGQVATHTFEVRNTGDAALEVSSVKGSCKCLQFKVEPSRIPPGGVGELYVRWRAPGKTGETFRQTIRIETNDPDQKTAQFVINGDVGGHLRLTPSRIEWKNAAPGEPRVATFRVASRHWPEVHVSELRCSIEGVACAVLTDQPEQGGPATRVVEVRAPPALTKEPFAGLITMTVSKSKPTAALVVGSRDRAADGPVEIQVPFALELAEPMTISGGGFDPETMTAYLGTLSPGKSMLRRYLIKVRDEEKRLTLLSKKAEPSSIEVKLEPYRPESGLYRLELALAPDSLGRAYIGKEAGRLELEFDHPRAKRLEFAIEVSPGR